MTNHWNDIKNSDVIMLIGSNAAENHPISFKWVQAALDDNGAKLIVVDPRYTRSASKASVVDGVQLYSKLRAGTDIAFIMGMMKWAIDHNKINWDYLKDCTNATFLLDPNFKTCRVANPHPDLGSVNGIFSGLVSDPRRHKKYKYDTSTWSYQLDPNPPAGTKQPLVDRTLQDPDCVWQKFIEQLSAYDIPTVCNITGADPVMVEKIYDVYTSTYEDHKSACIMYAMGSTQHTYGSQNVRSYAVLQLLLGNTGVAGGGINALRGESNVQGSTDMCLLWHILPGYLTVPKNTADFKDRAAYHNYYTTTHTPQDPTPGGGAGNPISLAWWKNGPRYIDSLLAAWWPLEHTGHANLDTAYQYLPKADKDYWYTHT